MFTWFALEYTKWDVLVITLLNLLGDFWQTFLNLEFSTHIYQLSVEFPTRWADHSWVSITRICGTPLACSLTWPKTVTLFTVSTSQMWPSLPCVQSPYKASTIFAMTDAVLCCVAKSLCNILSFSLFSSDLIFSEVREWNSGYFPNKACYLTIINQRTPYF